MEKINEEIRKAVNTREIYRYLGYGASIPDDNIKDMVTEILDELLRNVTPKCVYKVYDSRVMDDRVFLGDSGDTKGAENKMINAMIFQSRNLAGNLRSCGRTVLFAATLGIGADKLIQKYEILNMAKASGAQACGAECIEAYCNMMQEKICDEVSGICGEKLYLRPRFSPGYGDLALQNQKEIFPALECTKRIGLTLTDSLLMYPTKSVTAFIGLTREPPQKHAAKCEACDNMNCDIRPNSRGL